MDNGDVLPHPAAPLAHMAAEDVPSRILAGASVVGAYVITALIATWPLLLHLRTAVLRGTEQVSTVPVFDIWTLWWTSDRVAHGFTHYWDAPFFYPNVGVFTYSEPQPLTGLLVTPLWALGTSQDLVYNIALLGLLILDGIFAYRLACTLGGSRLSALLGGVLAITLPYTAKEFGVLPLIGFFGMLWTLEGLVRFGRNATVGNAAWAAAGFVALYLTCEQYALMFAPFALAAGMLALAQHRFRARATVRLVAMGMAAGLIVLIVAWPTLTLHQSILAGASWITHK